MIWLITLIILWVIGCVFYLSLFVVTKRADQMAEVMFANRSSRNDVTSANIITDEVQGLEQEKEILGNICLS